ncbi:MAG: aminoglycoside phosphotransferase family protein [Proteobacteria bacterium]|nr:aminoglycoside phosphotransferase family protein [Pseudomonadota bacterium]
MTAMRLGWTRAVPVLAPTADAVAAMVAAGLPGARMTGFAPVDGGLANTNLRVELESGRVLLRLYQRDPGQARKEAALAERLAGRVPIPSHLHAGRQGGYHYALVEWIDGERLEVALMHWSDAERAAAGVSVGHGLAAIHAVTFANPGFLDERLVPTPMDVGPDFILGFLRKALADGIGRARIGAALADATLRWARDHAALRWPGSPCLVHSDFNGSNILMRGTDVAAVVDWEFAMSGSPDGDFGNLLRNHPDEAFIEGVSAGYRAAGGTLPDDWRVLARRADLLAWADFLQRPDLHPSVIESARGAIAATIAL